MIRTAPEMDMLLRWEAAYSRFETSEQECRKFQGRLRRLGVGGWGSDRRILELFCGRGSGIRAWNALGFSHVTGLDLSRRLLAQYGGQCPVIGGDALALPFRPASFDAVCVQGGLHHLAALAEVDRALQALREVLRPGGHLLVVEPWMTPYLRAVHFLSGCRIGRLSKTLDAFATMVACERDTYERWLESGDAILGLFHRHFVIERWDVRWGKVTVVGRRAAG